LEPGYGARWRIVMKFMQRARESQPRPPFCVQRRNRGQTFPCPSPLLSSFYFGTIAKSGVLHNTALHSCTQSNQKSRMLVEPLSYRKAGEGWMLSLTKTKHSSIITVNFDTKIVAGNYCLHQYVGLRLERQSGPTQAHSATMRSY
jgi:hypothetical protein